MGEGGLGGSTPKGGGGVFWNCNHPLDALLRSLAAAHHVVPPSITPR